ncbi:hypothetical protein D3C81_1484880 [compost metagenome]
MNPLDLLHRILLRIAEQQVIARALQHTFDAIRYRKVKVIGVIAGLNRNNQPNGIALPASERTGHRIRHISQPVHGLSHSLLHFNGHIPCVIDHI